MDNTSSNTNSREDAEKAMLPLWELLFENSNKGEKMNTLLEKLLNKRIKVWNALATTVGGVRGTWKGQIGLLTDFDDEFIVLDNQCMLSRKFIFRIETV